jgi:hypothetical protein
MNKDAGKSYSVTGTRRSPGEITASGWENARLQRIRINLTGVSALASSADQGWIARLGEGLRLFHYGSGNHNEEGYMGELDLQNKREDFGIERF